MPCLIRRDSHATSYWGEQARFYSAYLSLSLYVYTYVYIYIHIYIYIYIYICMKGTAASSTDAVQEIVQLVIMWVLTTVRNICKRMSHLAGGSRRASSLQASDRAVGAATGSRMLWEG